jgi:hypothetical protein
MKVAGKKGKGYNEPCYISTDDDVNDTYIQITGSKLSQGYPIIFMTHV